MSRHTFRRLNTYLNIASFQLWSMSLEITHDCPECDSETFYRAASTTLHLGEKTKWRCTSCGYTYVKIDEITSLPA